MEKLVSREAHNLKIGGSSPSLATKKEIPMTESEIEKIIALGKEFPNNQDLGRKYRSLFRMEEFARSRPNDFDLGAALRKIILEKTK